MAAAGGSASAYGEIAYEKAAAIMYQMKSQRHGSGMAISKLA